MKTLGELRRFESGSEISVEGDSVIFCFRDFDTEDNREYDYVGNFSKGDYENALKKLEETGSAVLEVSKSKGGCGLTMLKSDGNVILTLYGTCSSSTPGGASLTGRIKASYKLEELKKLM